MTSKLSRSIAVGLVFALQPACGKDHGKAGTAASASAVPSSQAAEAPPAMPSARMPTAPPSGAPSAAPIKAVRRRGTTGEVFNLARTLNLKEEQKVALDKIDDELWGETSADEETKTALRDYVGALIDGTKAGKIETAKLGPYYKTLEASSKTRHETEAKALNDLHSMLDADQRKALVEILRRRHPAPNAQKPKPNPPIPAPPRPSGAKPAASGVPPALKQPPILNEKAQQEERLKRRVARMTAMLTLDEPQQKRIEPVLKRFDIDAANKTHREQIDKRMNALINAFEKDEFDATKLDLGKGPRARMESRVDFLTSLLTILKPDQRERLARTIERPSGRWWGGAIAGEAGPIDES